MQILSRKNSIGGRRADVIRSLAELDALFGRKPPDKNKKIAQLRGTGDFKNTSDLHAQVTTTGDAAQEGML